MGDLLGAIVSRHEDPRQAVEHRTWCMNDSADLEGAGLPNDPLYGVCK
jgi:hypothetical protein